MIVGFKHKRAPLCNIWVGVCNMNFGYWCVFRFNFFPFHGSNLNTYYTPFHAIKVWHFSLISQLFVNSVRILKKFQYDGESIVVQQRTASVYIQSSQRRQATWILVPACIPASKIGTEKGLKCNTHDVTKFQLGRGVTCSAQKDLRYLTLSSR